MSMNVSGGFDSSAKKASLTDLKIAAQKKHEVSSSDQKITEVVMHTGFLGAFLNLVTRNYQAISMKDAKGDAKIFYVSIHSLSDKLDISPPDCRELLKHFGDWEKLTRTVNQVDEFIKKELEQRPHLDSRQKWFLEFVLKSFRAQFLHVASGTDDRDFKWDRLGIEIEKKEGKFSLKIKNPVFERQGLLDGSVKKEDRRTLESMSLDTSQKLLKGEFVFEDIDTADFGERDGDEATITTGSVSLSGDETAMVTDLPPIKPLEEYEAREPEGQHYKKIPRQGLLSGVSSYAYNKLFGLNLPPQN